jgi:hypothetical protein
MANKTIANQFFKMCDKAIWFRLFKKTVKENYLNTGNVELTDTQFDECYEIAKKKTFDEIISCLCERGLLEETPNKDLKITNKGLFFSNHLKNKN